MSLREKLTAARENGREQRELARASQRRLVKAMELRKLGVPIVLQDGWPDSALTENDLDVMLAAEKKRQPELYETFVRAATVTVFDALDVQVLAGDERVYSIGCQDDYARTNDSRVLGLLSGAEARVTDATSSFSPGKAALMPIALAPLARKETADVLIVFADGTTYAKELDGSRAVRDARRQCVEFNALPSARASAGSAAIEAGADPAARLQKLEDLRDAGLLSQEEYEAKRAGIIDSI